MRKRVSILIEYGYFALIPIALVGVLNLVEIYTNKQFDLFAKYWFPIVILTVLCGSYFLIKYLIKTNLKVEFDQEAMHNGQISIPFKNIISIKMTASHFLNRHKLKVDYLNEEGDETFFTFYPRFTYYNIDELVKAIETKNPEAKLQKIFKGSFLLEKYKN
jgi:hypothetical protein